MAYVTKIDDYLNEMSKKQFGKRVALLRKARAVSQSNLAEVAGVSLQFLSSVERGVASPSFGTIERLASALNVSMAELFLWEHEESAETCIENSTILRPAVSPRNIGGFSYNSSSNVMLWDDSLYAFLGARKGRHAPNVKLIEKVFENCSGEIGLAIKKVQTSRRPEVCKLLYKESSGTKRSIALALTAIEYANSSEILIVGQLLDFSDSDKLFNALYESRNYSYDIVARHIVNNKDDLCCGDHVEKCSVLFGVWAESIPMQRMMQLPLSIQAIHIAM